MQHAHEHTSGTRHRRQTSGRAVRQRDFAGMLRHRGQCGSLGAEGAPHRHNVPFQKQSPTEICILPAGETGGGSGSSCPTGQAWFFSWSAKTFSGGWTPGSCLSIHLSRCCTLAAELGPGEITVLSQLQSLSSPSSSRREKELASGFAQQGRSPPGWALSSSQTAYARCCSFPISSFTRPHVTVTLIKIQQTNTASPF